MIIKATHRFIRDLEKIKSAEILDDIEFALDEIEKAKSPQDIAGFKSSKNFEDMGGSAFQIIELASSSQVK